MSVLGTELKFNVHIEPIDGFHMSDYDFECSIYAYTNRRVFVKKSEMKKVDDDNYIIIIDSEQAQQIGRGTLAMEVTAYIPDNDFEDGLRTEKALTWTGVTII